ncbi:receptor activity-modifying protein 1 [Puma concolor]|uniref:Receptor activity-modifying protein 1 n=1 Tax=Puma concolor TaxID=9696 RepID=A0A6P6IDQ8_PUMCO|nr:receptor activity-modifying protein 1 [Puma concolor]
MRRRAPAGSCLGPLPARGLMSRFCTRRSYKVLTDCTRHVADQLGCFWPNAAVDKFFVAVHRHYFRNCPVSGRAVRDPPRSILCPFIAVPILVTLLVTALVVWRSKRPEGVV